VDDRIRMEVLESVVLEAELADRRARLDQVVRGRARVVQEARKSELLGRGVAADDRPLLEHEHLEARQREVGGGDEAVVPGACDDDVRLRHASPW
jgi:hypothetical protein